MGHEDRWHLPEIGTDVSLAVTIFFLHVFGRFLFAEAETIGGVLNTRFERRNLPDVKGV